MTTTATSEHPIIFSGPMVKAILAGRKTQTRRIVKPQPPSWMRAQLDSGQKMIRNIDRDLWGAGTRNVCRMDNTIRCPFGAVGSRLWVREAFMIGHDAGNGMFSVLRPTGRTDQDGKVFYKAGRDWDESEGRYLWRSPIHMPRWASRITLEVTEVRVQRLQEISEADAIAEGIHPLPFQSASDPSAWYESASGVDQARSAIASFRLAWNKINPKTPWESNPWVWVLSFRVLTSPESASPPRSDVLG